ncbi:hypothetical protein [Flammeovirga aprica]|uniref:Lipoprotein n=1 Tax=Flammeovirga aprica JL-4 TaxID=694437 RepID=A0A7X9RYW9_9BACT|nr:hypothetical protein [Flammeovirga aprica]NME71258.1 hypothetical protein [Flammeovirga aprica JL-4]
MKNYQALFFFFVVFFGSCESESCKIDFLKNEQYYIEALEKIHSLHLEMNSNQFYYRPILSISQRDEILNAKLSTEIQFIECHADSTIIFQAPNCNNEYALRDVVYFLAYAPKGIEQIKHKRNLGGIEEVSKNWYLCKHIYSLAN